MKLSRLVIIGSLVFITSCSKTDATPEPEEPLAPTVNLTVVQNDVKIPEATVKFIYDDNGQDKTETVLTNSDGKISMDLPLNKEMQMTITSKCGILLYDWKVGPFTESKKMDTTLAMEAYSPDCETAEPAEFYTFNLYGVIYRFTSEKDVLGFSLGNGGGDGIYGARRNDYSAGIRLDLNYEALWPTIVGVSPHHALSPSFYAWGPDVKMIWDQQGQIGELCSGKFVLDMKAANTSDNAPDSIPGTFKFIRRHYKSDPNWEEYFPE